MSDPRIVGLNEAVTTQVRAEDVFGATTSPVQRGCAEEWQQVRTAGIPTERIASECYRHALRVARTQLREAVADYSEVTA